MFFHFPEYEHRYPFEFRSPDQQQELFEGIMGTGKYEADEDRGALRGMNMLLSVTPRDAQGKDGAKKF